MKTLCLCIQNRAIRQLRLSRDASFTFAFSPICAKYWSLKNHSQPTRRNELQKLNSVSREDFKDEGTTKKKHKSNPGPLMNTLGVLDKRQRRPHYSCNTQAKLRIDQISILSPSSSFLRAFLSARMTPRCSTGRHLRHILRSQEIFNQTLGILCSHQRPQMPRPQIMHEPLERAFLMPQHLRVCGNRLRAYILGAKWNDHIFRQTYWKWGSIPHIHADVVRSIYYAALFKRSAPLFIRLFSFFILSRSVLQNTFHPLAILFSVILSNDLASFRKMKILAAIPLSAGTFGPPRHSQFLYQLYIISSLLEISFEAHFSLRCSAWPE